MKKYKVEKKKRVLPSDKEISEYQDFSKLRANYDLITKPSKEPLYKNRKLFLLLLIIALVAYLIFSDEGKESTEESTPPSTEIKK